MSKVPAQKTSNLVNPLFFPSGTDPFSTVKWVRKNAVIVGADGRERFRLNDVEVPESWSQNTIDIVAEKYFRRVNGVQETSAKQMFHRIAFWITKQGIAQGILEGGIGTRDTMPPSTMGVPNGEVVFWGPAVTYYNELLYMMLHGMQAFNSPVWFNVGVVDKPQCSACFIQSVEDTMESIVDLSAREMMLFKGGSGTGSNLSPLRSSYERLSGGGWSSGPVSFMKHFDSGAGVTKSGGGTRRAAKMVVMNADHPDILRQSNGEAGFITCKSTAEKLAQDLYSTGKYTAEWNKPGNVYDLVPYQNANNSVRVTDEFMKAVEADGDWQTKEVKSGKPVHNYKAQELFNEMAEAAWVCGDPGIQFDTTTNEMHTCPNSGRINASNPCSEYLFLDDTACNLSSINLMKFAKGTTFDVEGYVHACEISIIAKEIIVDASSYPSDKIRERSHQYRTLGLGFTNLGALLTYWGLPYDSHEGRAIAGTLTAIMAGAAYKTSAALAAIKGPFPEYEKNKEEMLRVIRKHLESAKKLPTLINKDWQDLPDEALSLWKEALAEGKKHGFRNAQVVVIAPTGTISFLMDADTTGIEPMLGAMVYKKIVGEGVVRMPSRIIEPALQNLGYNVVQISSILDYVQKNGTVWNCPEVNSKHYPVFAEALGEHALTPKAHVDMMIAVQPFVSGGISKTVNMPASATAKDIADIYMRAWKGGLKCVAVFRDGCKLSQPISTKLTDASANKQTMKWGERRRMPRTRNSKTHKFIIGQQEGYLTAGLYDDGSLGEIFIEIAMQGSTLNGIVDAWATAVSIGLQHGVPFDVLKDKFCGMRFDPEGFTDDETIRIAKSIPDYIFRWLELNIINKDKAVEAGEYRPTIPVEEKPLRASLDGPPCSKCGNLTKRAGSCYVCSSCGTTTGCS